MKTEAAVPANAREWWKIVFNKILNQTSEDQLADWAEQFQSGGQACIFAMVTKGTAMITETILMNAEDWHKLHELFEERAAQIKNWTPWGGRRSFLPG